MLRGAGLPMTEGVTGGAEPALERATPPSSLTVLPSVPHIPLPPPHPSTLTRVCCN
jgi:hypothetical protein